MAIDFRRAWVVSLLLLLQRLSIQQRVNGFQSFAASPRSARETPNERQQTFGINRRRRESAVLYHSSTTPPTQEEEESISYADEDAPAGIGGAQFFGGNKRKAEFYDPVAEANAGLTADFAFVDRFKDPVAFPDKTATTLALELQELLLRRTDASSSQPVEEEALYVDSPNLQWDSPFAEKEKYANPLEALTALTDFFRNKLNIAITSAKALSNELVEIRWEISVVYPTLWEPSIVLTGTSELKLNGAQIVAQRDQLDNEDAAFDQFVPRFWDVYHIGMTPASEDRTRRGPNSNINGGGWSYQIVSTPPRWVWQVTMMDEDRSSNNAAHLPEHAFTTIVKTVGPMKQSYQTVTGTSVELEPCEDGKVQITWNIPLSVAYAAERQWRTVPGEDAQFVFLPAQYFAVSSYGGSGPQDNEIAAARQRLYHAAVEQGGHIPLCSPETGRPKFSYGMDSVKACYTGGGMGMVVYEWRPSWSRSNHVALELQHPSQLLSPAQ